MNFLAKRMTFFLLKRNIIQCEDREVYEYSFEILFSTILNFLILITLAIITKKYFETILFSAVFITVRKLVGGYHAKTHIGCTLTLILVYLGVIFSIYYIDDELLKNISNYLIVPYMMIILLLSPVIHPNNPVDYNKKQALRMKSIGITAVLSLIVIIFNYLEYFKYAYIISYSILIVSLFLIVGYVLNGEKMHLRP